MVSIEAGDAHAADELLPIVYEQLRRIAKQHMAQERADHTLQATALVHEAYLKLIGGEDIRWANRTHFYSAAAEAMRRILVDHARKRGRGKRGGDRRRVPLILQGLFVLRRRVGHRTERPFSCLAGAVRFRYGRRYEIAQHDHKTAWAWSAPFRPLLPVVPLKRHKPRNLLLPTIFNLPRGRYAGL